MFTTLGMSGRTGPGGIKKMSVQHPRCDASINTTANAGNNTPLGSGGIEGQGGLTNGVNSGRWRISFL